MTYHEPDGDLGDRTVRAYFFDHRLNRPTEPQVSITKKKAFAATLAVVVALLGYFYWTSKDTPFSTDPTGPSPTDPLAGAASSVSGPALPAIESKARSSIVALLDSGMSIQESVAAGSGGREVNDPYAASLLIKASVACGESMDATNTLEGPRVDASRLWARERLTELCYGFDETKFNVSASAIDFGTMAKRQGEAVAVEEARRTLRSGAGYFDMYGAGQLLMETGHFPLQEVAGAAGPEPGMPELMQAWAHAVTLDQCERYGGCGPKSFEVAAFCLSMGCKEGVTFVEALRARLPAEDFRRVQAFQRWIVVNRGT